MRRPRPRVLGAARCDEVAGQTRGAPEDCRDGDDAVVDRPEGLVAAAARAGAERGSGETPHSGTAARAAPTAM